MLDLLYIDYSKERLITPKQYSDILLLERDITLSKDFSNLNANDGLTDDNYHLPF